MGFAERETRLRMGYESVGVGDRVPDRWGPGTMNNQTGFRLVTKQVPFSLHSAPQHWLEAQRKAINYRCVPRWLHHFWAWLVGYYWMPCDLCQRPYGGHESCWATDGNGRCVCPECAVNGKAFTTEITLHQSVPDSES